MYSSTGRHKGPQGLLTSHYHISEALLPVGFSVFAPEAKEVFLIGDMSNWLENKIPMHPCEDGFWRLNLQLRHGQWMYKFEVDGQCLADPNNPFQAEDGLRAGQKHSYLFIGNGYWSAKPDVPQGQLLKQEHCSQLLQRSIPYHLYIPPPAKENTHYPLLTLLHGHQTIENQWPQNGRLANYMDNLLSKGLIQPFAVLMPAGHDQVEMPLYARMLIEELIPSLTLNHPIQPTQDKQAIAGMSIQDYGPLAFALDYPHNFIWVAPINEHFSDEVLKQAEYLSERPFSIKLYCTRESCSFPRNQQLIQMAKGKLNYMQLFGKPTWRTWNGITRELLMSASSAFQNAHPTDNKQ